MLHAQIDGEANESRMLHDELLDKKCAKFGLRSAHVFFFIAPMPWDDRFPETPPAFRIYSGFTHKTLVSFFYIWPDHPWGNKSPVRNNPWHSLKEMVHGARIRRLNSIVCSPLFLFSALHAQTSCPLDATGNKNGAQQAQQARLPNQKSTCRNISGWVTWLKWSKMPVYIKCWIWGPPAVDSQMYCSSSLLFETTRTFSDTR